MKIGNSTPFKATQGPENPKPEDFSPALGIETGMLNRALRAMELLSADSSITEEEFQNYKFDISYSNDSAIAKSWKTLCDAPKSDDPLVNEALDVARRWDLRTNVENPATAISLLTIGPGSDDEVASHDLTSLLALLKSNAEALKQSHGRIDVPWGDVNRLKRGTVNLPTAGGPDVLHAVYGSRVSHGKLEGLENGQLHGRAGDCLIILVTWDKNGKVHSKSIHQYGSATSRPDSKHYADQAPLFVACKLKPVWMDESEIRAHLER